MPRQRSQVGYSLTRVKPLKPRGGIPKWMERLCKKPEWEEAIAELARYDAETLIRQRRGRRRGSRNRPSSSTA